MTGSNNCEIEIKGGVIKKFKLKAEWEDEELFKSRLGKMIVLDQTLSHTLHICDAKWIQKIRENLSRGQKKRDLPKKLEAKMLFEKNV